MKPGPGTIEDTVLYHGIKEETPNDAEGCVGGVHFPHVRNSARARVWIRK